MGINLFDVVVLAVLLTFALFSYMRGAVREVASLFGLAGGYWAATRFYIDLGEMLTPIVRDKSLAELLSIVFILALGYLIGTFISGFGEAMSRRTPGLPNSVVGAVVGLLKGLVICLALFWIIEDYILPFQDELASSASGPYLVRVLELLSDFDLL